MMAQPRTYPPASAPLRPRSYWRTPGGIVLIVFGSTLFVVLWVVGVLAIRAAFDRAASRHLEAEVVACSTTGRVGRATVEVRNGDDRPHDAEVLVEYRNAQGQRLDTDTIKIRDLAPGARGRGETMTILNVPSQTIECRPVAVAAG